MLQVLSILLLVASCVAQVPYTSSEVSFLSFAPSGNITLTGTLLLPTLSRLVGGVVLVAGSGPGQRNESAVGAYPNWLAEGLPSGLPACGVLVVRVSIFTEIAEALASAGYAVLRYDKRSCVKQSQIPGCNYDLCPINDDEPADKQSQNVPGACVDLRLLSVTDFAIDAANAVQFLRNNYPSIDKTDITLIGHSQGCSVVPNAAALVGAGVKRIIQLAGIGITIDSVLIAQAEVLSDTFASGEKICNWTGGNPQIGAFFTQEKEATEILLEQAATEFPKIVAGDYKRTDWVRIGGLLSAGFWMDWIAWGDFGAIYNTTLALSKQGVQFLSVNSPSDGQVWPQFYSDLHAVTYAIPTGQVKIIPGLTHLLTPASLTTNEVDQRVIDAIIHFLRQ